MEKTLEEKVPDKDDVPDYDQGGMGRRLRDRDMLRKRKAEAEERASTQWGYGVQSSKRTKRETNSVPKRKGRPRKNLPETEQHLETTDIPDVGETETSRQSEEIISVPSSSSVFTLESAQIPAPDVPQIPTPVSLPIPLPAPEVTQEIKPSSDALLQEVLIEDLGSDEEEDDKAQQELVIEKGGVEEPSVIDTEEQNKAFSDTVLASPQSESLPGNLI